MVVRSLLRSYTQCRAIWVVIFLAGLIALAALYTFAWTNQTLEIGDLPLVKPSHVIVHVQHTAHAQHDGRAPPGTERAEYKPSGTSVDNVNQDKETRTTEATLTSITTVAPRVTSVEFVFEPTEMQSYSSSDYIKHETETLTTETTKPDQLKGETGNLPKSKNHSLQKANGINSFHQAIATPPPGEKCKRRLPQAIIVGIQKCGTSALLTFLNKHPQIAACMQPAETKYFTVRYHKQPLEFYRNMMPCSYSNQITMEKSPPYFYRPYIAGRIKNMNPDTKIIIIVKDPIVRAQSNYAMRLAHRQHKQVPSFDSTVTVPGTPYRVKGRCIMIRFSRYPGLMAGWLKYFNLSQIHIVDGHALETDPAATLNKVEHFLGVGTYFTPEKFIFNNSKGKYCYTGNTVRECLADNKGRDHPTIGKQARVALEQYFKPRNEEFFKLIHQKFDWGY